MTGKMKRKIHGSFEITPEIRIYRHNFYSARYIGIVMKSVYICTSNFPYSCSSSGSSLVVVVVLLRINDDIM